MNKFKSLVWLSFLFVGSQAGLSAEILPESLAMGPKEQSQHDLIQTKTQTPEIFQLLEIFQNLTNLSFLDLSYGSKKYAETIDEYVGVVKELFKDYEENGTIPLQEGIDSIKEETDNLENAILEEVPIYNLEKLYDNRIGKMRAELDLMMGRSGAKIFKLKLFFGKQWVKDLPIPLELKQQLLSPLQQLDERRQRLLEQLKDTLQQRLEQLNEQRQLLESKLPWLKLNHRWQKLHWLKQQLEWAVGEQQLERAVGKLKWARNLAWEDIWNKALAELPVGSQLEWTVGEEQEQLKWAGDLEMKCNSDEDMVKEIATNTQLKWAVGEEQEWTVGEPDEVREQLDEVREQLDEVMKQVNEVMKQVNEVMKQVNEVDVQKSAEFEEFEMAHDFEERFKIPPGELQLLLLSKKNLKNINGLTNLYKNIFGRDMTTDEAVQLLHMPEEKRQQEREAYQIMCNLSEIYKKLFRKDMPHDEKWQLLHMPEEQLEQKIKGFKKIHTADVVYKSNHGKYISDELLSRMRRESEFFAELSPREVYAWVEKKEQYALLWGD